MHQRQQGRKHVMQLKMAFLVVIHGVLQQDVVPHLVMLIIIRMDAVVILVPMYHLQTQIQIANPNWKQGIQPQTLPVENKYAHKKELLNAQETCHEPAIVRGGPVVQKVLQRVLVPPIVAIGLMAAGVLGQIHLGVPMATATIVVTRAFIQQPLVVRHVQTTQHAVVAAVVLPVILAIRKLATNVLQILYLVNLGNIITAHHMSHAHRVIIAQAQITQQRVLRAARLDVKLAIPHLAPVQPRRRSVPNPVLLTV